MHQHTERLASLHRLSPYGLQDLRRASGFDSHFDLWFDVEFPK
jgi:hypothetical protein